ncbi:phospholipase domain-containing protein [Streptomyces sp. NPDC048111]|uniref:phospholipase domain-containing protein n=1 Tax=Streptomyces sp. NPDC048111 TaxID=3365500 RepID=UPI0037118EC7
MRHTPKQWAVRRAVALVAAGTALSTAAALPARGPEPSVSAVDDCARGGVDVTAGNRGDTAFTFRLAGVAASVAPGGTRTILVPVAAGQSYRFTVLGPGGFRQEVAGVLDCAPASPAPSASAGGAGADRAADARAAPAGPRESVARAAGRPVALAGVTDLGSLVAGAVLVLLGALLFVIRRLAL